MLRHAPSIEHTHRKSEIHMHSTFSDGEFSPEQLVDIAQKNNVTLLSLTEVLGGIFWVWLPWFGINEVPSVNTLIGGAIIISAIIFYGYNTKRVLQSRYV